MMTWTRDITNGLIDRGLPAAQALKIADGGKLTQVMGAAPTRTGHRGPFQLAVGTRSSSARTACSVQRGPGPPLRRSALGATSSSAPTA